MPGSRHDESCASMDERQSWEQESRNPLARSPAGGTAATVCWECRSLVCLLDFQVPTVAACVCITKEVTKGDGVWGRGSVWLHPGDS